MKKRVMTFVAACLALSVCAQKNGHTGYPITPVPFTAVKVNDAFWGQRLKASREVTIPLAFSKCEETGRYKNFEMAANPGPHNKVTGFSFDDTDVYKTIEGASYLLQTYPDEKLKKYIDSVLVIVARAQLRARTAVESLMGISSLIIKEKMGRRRSVAPPALMRI